MGQRNKVTLFFAVMLIAGGLIGLAMVVITITGTPFVEQNWLVISMMAVFAVLFAWATFTGLRLWQGTPYGGRWAPILFASQVPILAISDLSYQWYTGALFGPALQFGGDNSGLEFKLGAGANIDVSFGYAVTESIIGLNLFALLAVVLLVRANRSFKTQPLDEAQPVSTDKPETL